jgi:hypothetical protein
VVIDAEDVVGPVCFHITELIPATPAYFYKPVAVGVEAVVAVPGPVHAAGMPSRFRDFFGDRWKRGNPSVVGCHVRLSRSTRHRWLQYLQLVAVATWPAGVGAVVNSAARMRWMVDRPSETA